MEHCGRGSGVRIVGQQLVTQSRDREGATGCAHPRSNSVPSTSLIRGRGIWVGAVGVVVSRACEGGLGVTGVSYTASAPDERILIAELAVLRVEHGSGVGPVPGSFMHVTIIVAHTRSDWVG